MSGPTIYGSNGKEQFTTSNPAVVQSLAEATGKLQKVNIAQSDIQVPIQIQSRLTKMNQLHNNVMVAPNTWNQSTGWVDCSLFEKIGVTFTNDGATASQVSVLWSNDGTNAHGEETLQVNSSPSSFRRSGIVEIKAPYMRLSVQNGDASPKTMNTWVYFK